MTQDDLKLLDTLIDDTYKLREALLLAGRTGKVEGASVEVAQSIHSGVEHLWKKTRGQ